MAGGEGRDNAAEWHNLMNILERQFQCVEMGQDENRRENGGLGWDDGINNRDGVKQKDSGEMEGRLLRTYP